MCVFMLVYYFICYSNNSMIGIPDLEKEFDRIIMNKTPVFIIK